MNKNKQRLLKKLKMAFYQKLYKKTIQKNQRGVSIVNSILGFALLGVSTVGLATYVGNFEEVQVNYKQQSELHSLHSELQSSMKQILFSVNIKVNSSLSITEGKKSYGICSLVNEDLNYDDISDLYSGTVNVKEGSVATKSFSSSLGGYLSLARWKYFIGLGGRWSEASGSCAKDQNGFTDDFTEDIRSRCFQLNNPLNVNRPKAYARLLMVPKNLLSKQKLSSASTTKMSVDEVSYELTSIVSQRKPAKKANKDIWDITTASHLAWMAEALECAVCKDASLHSPCRLVRLSPGGIGSASLNKNLYYHSQITSKNMCQALEISHVSKNVNQLLAVTQKGILTADRDAQVAMSCISNVFKCKKDPKRFQSNYFDHTFRLGFELNLDTMMPSNIDSIQTKIKRGAQTYKPGTAFLSAHHTSYPGQKENASSPYSYEEADGRGRWPLLPGGNYHTLYVTNKVGSSSICENVCKSPGSYYPELTVKWNSRAGKQCSQTIALDGRSNRPDARISCTTCHTKACHGYGSGTFGSEQGTPDEPRDSSIPECTLYDRAISQASSLKLQGKPSKGKELVLMANGKLSGVAPPATGKKTACFINGKYQVVSDSYTGSNGSTLTMGSKTQACYRSSYRRVKKEHPNPSNLKLHEKNYTGALPHLAVAYDESVKKINRTLSSIPTTSITNGSNTETHYEFYNSASQGLFITPESKLSRLAGTNNNKLMVNFQTDQAGMVLGGWIPIDDQDINKSSVDSKAKWAYFYREPFSSSSFSDASTVVNTTTTQTCTCEAGETMNESGKCCTQAQETICPSGAVFDESDGKCYEGYYCDPPEGDINRNCEYPCPTTAWNQEGRGLNRMSELPVDSVASLIMPNLAYASSGTDRTEECCGHLPGNYTYNDTTKKCEKPQQNCNHIDSGWKSTKCFDKNGKIINWTPNSPAIPHPHGRDPEDMVWCVQGGSFELQQNPPVHPLMVPKGAGRLYGDNQPSNNLAENCTLPLLCYKGVFLGVGEPSSPFELTVDECTAGENATLTPQHDYLYVGRVDESNPLQRHPRCVPRKCYGTKKRKEVPPLSSGTSSTCSAPDSANCQSITSADRQNILRRSRPARPVFVKLPHGSSNLDYPKTASALPTASNHSDARLLLTHHMHYKGLRKVKNTVSNSYHYLCRRISDFGIFKKQFVLSSSKASSFSSGYSACPRGYAFLPPDTPELFISALHTVNPNHPRYPFPNPFNFQDGIPFRKYLDGKYSYRYADMHPSDYKLSYKLENSFYFDHASVDQFDSSTTKRRILAPVRSAWVALRAVVSGGGDIKKASDWYYHFQAGSGTGKVNSNGIYSYSANHSNIITQLNTNTANMNDTYNTNTNANIGLINSKGLMVKKRFLRGDRTLSRFLNLLTMACRFSDGEEVAKFYKAPIFRGSHRSWPGTTQANSCKSLNATTSPIHGAYGGIRIAKRSNASVKNNLKPMGVNDWTDMIKGIRAAHPLYQIIHNKNVLVQNQKKFCTEWRKEKLRRHTGRQIIAKYNTHGKPQTKVCRQKNSNKREMCDEIERQLQSDINRAKTELDRLEALEEIQTKCLAAKPTCESNCADYNSSVTACSGVSCTSPWRRSPSYCGNQKNCTQECKCDETDYDPFIEAQEKKISCLQSAFTKSKGGHCESSIGKDATVSAVTQSYTISPTKDTSSCSGSYSASYNNLKARQCWSVDKITPTPSYQADYPSHSSGLGVSGHKVSANYRGSCNWPSNMSLRDLNANGCKDYLFMANIIDNKLCNDETGLSPSFSDSDLRNYPWTSSSYTSGMNNQSSITAVRTHDRNFNGSNLREFDSECVCGYLSCGSGKYKDSSTCTCKTCTVGMSCYVAPATTTGGSSTTTTTTGGSSTGGSSTTTTTTGGSSTGGG